MLKRFTNLAFLLASLAYTPQSFAISPPDHTYALLQASPSVSQPAVKPLEFLQVSAFSGQRQNALLKGSFPGAITQWGVGLDQNQNPMLVMIDENNQLNILDSARQESSSRSDYRALTMTSPTQFILTDSRNYYYVLDPFKRNAAGQPNGLRIFNVPLMSPSAFGIIERIEKIGPQKYLFVASDGQNILTLAAVTWDLVNTPTMNYYSSLGGPIAVDGTMITVHEIKGFVANSNTAWILATALAPAGQAPEIWLLHVEFLGAGFKIADGHRLHTADVELLDIDPTNQTVLVRCGTNYIRHYVGQSSKDLLHVESLGDFDPVLLAQATGSALANRTISVTAKSLPHLSGKLNFATTTPTENINSSKNTVDTGPRTKADFRNAFDREAVRQGIAKLGKEETAREFKNRVNMTDGLRYYFKAIPSHELKKYHLIYRLGDLLIVDGHEGDKINVDQILTLLEQTASVNCTSDLT